MVNVPQGGREIVLADVTLGNGKTVTVRIGDWLSRVSLAGFVTIVVFQVATERCAMEAAGSTL